MKVVELLAPSFWAVGLINEDWTAYDEEERLAAELWLKENNLPHPVSCEDAGYHRTHDAFSYFPYECECSVYTFLLDD